MAAPTIKRIVVEDFPDQKSWIGKLLLPLNQALQSISKSLTKGLTFEDNFKAQIKTLDFVKAADSFPLYFACTVAGPQGVLILKAVPVTGSASPTIASAVWADWESTEDGRIKVTNLTGLTDGTRYKVTFLVV